MSKLQDLLYSHFLASRAVQSAMKESSKIGVKSTAKSSRIDPLKAIRGLIKMCSHPDLVIQI